MTQSFDEDVAPAGDQDVAPAGTETVPDRMAAEFSSLTT
jgi:hypothetical protein